MPPILHLTQVGVTQLARPIDTGTLILAEPGVVAGNLSAGSVEGSSETSPEGDEVGGHVPVASGVNLPQAGVSLVRSLVEALVLRHPVLGVDHTHFGG